MARNSEKIKHSRSLDPVQELRVIDLGMVNDSLSSTAKVLWHRLVRWTNSEDGHSWAGRRKLAEWINRKSNTTISNATKELRDAELIIVTSRRGDTNLIRPNWEMIDQLLASRKRVDQKTGRGGGQKFGRGVDQKTGRNRTDLDSTERDSTIPSASHRNSGRADADRDALLVSGDVVPPALPAGSDDRKRYRQGKAEAEQAFSRLKRMPWLTESDDPDYQPSPRADDAALIHYHRLLKAGIAAGRIEQAAVKFLAECPDNQRPCLASFLARYASDYFEFDPSQPEKFVPDECPAMNDNDPPAAAVNDNVRPPERKAVGGSWVSEPCEEDAPF